MALPSPILCYYVIGVELSWNHENEKFILSNDTDICHILFFMSTWHTPNSKWFDFTRLNESHKRWNSLTILLAFLQLFHTRKLFSESKIKHIVLIINLLQLLFDWFAVIFNIRKLFSIQIAIFTHQAIDLVSSKKNKYQHGEGVK